MMSLITDDAEQSATLQTDRRRPGRLAGVSPDLIPILRGDEVVELAPEPAEPFEPDQLSAARGMLVGVLLSAPLWFSVAAVGHWLLS